MSRPIPIHHNMTRARFETEIEPGGQPAVLKGFVADWPAVAAGRESPEALAAYLGRFDSGRPVRTSIGAASMKGRFTYADDFKGFNYDRVEIPLAELIDRVLKARGDPAAPHIYAGGVPEPAVLPGLAADNPMPLLDADKERLTSLWIGNRSRTAAHWDLPQNLACVLAGRRRFTLFPIDQIDNLYVGPLDFTPAGQAVSLVDFADVDHARFPRFAQAQAHAQCADLAPGDALFIPSMWWHHMEAQTPFNVLVNYWWRQAPAWANTPMDTLMLAIMSIRDLPPAERAIWRDVFRHYVFDYDEDTVAGHVPAPARRSLAPLDETRAREIRARLLKRLNR